MEIRIYTEPHCGACIEAKKFLKSHGISFEERDVQANPEYLRILTEDPDGCTLPTLIAGDPIIPGFDWEEYNRLAALNSPGKLRRSAYGGLQRFARQERVL